jgi:hypothetical protein
VSAIAAAVAYCLLAAAAGFQVALVLGAPWGRCAYGGRSVTEDGRLPTRLRVASGGTVLVLGLAAVVVHAGHHPVLTWALVGLFTLNTAANLGGTHPVERWGMSAVTLALAGAFLTLGLA